MNTGFACQSTGHSSHDAIMLQVNGSMETLVDGARELGLNFSPDQIDKFNNHYTELISWNKRINLTTIVDCQEAQLKHFLDSLTAVKVLSEDVRAGGRVLDLGSGAGFPGVPLKIACPGIRLTLTDSVGKKTAFLQHLVSVLELADVQVYTGRAEDLAHDSQLRESFDLVLSRGVAPMRVLAEYTLPFCRVGGVAVTFKKGNIILELEASARAIDLLGGGLIENRPVLVSGLENDRSLVLVDKLSPTPIKFPRRPGIPAKHPL